MALEFDRFDKAAQAFTDAILDGSVRVGCGPAGSAQLISWDRKRLTEIGERCGLTDEDLDAAEDELEEILTAHAAAASFESFITRRLTEDDATEPEEIARRKFDLVASLFPIDRLQAESWWRYTSTAAGFYTVGWEVFTKLADDDFANPSRAAARVGRLELVTARWNEDRSSLVRSRIHANMTSLDVDILIAALTRLREALETDS